LQKCFIVNSGYLKEPPGFTGKNHRITGKKSCFDGIHAIPEMPAGKFYPETKTGPGPV
jgi:hypothetical protein